MPPREGSNGQSARSRARQSPAVDPQQGLFDKVWDDPELEQALEEREQKRIAASFAKGEYDVAKDNAKSLLEAYELEVGEVARVGRFRVKKTQPEPSHVEFTTDPQPRLNIGTIDEA